MPSRPRMPAPRLYNGHVAYHGMAALPGTGPAGARCWGCRHYVTGERQVPMSSAQPQYCWRFRELTGKVGEKVPASAAACRHYEERPREDRR